MPAAVHPHVCVQHQVAGKGHQDVFPAGDHTLDGASGQGSIVIDARQRGKHRLEAGDDAAGEMAVEGLGRAEDRVTFGHGTSLDSRARRR